MEASSSLSQHSSVYSIITEQIVQQLESGVAPWRKPWNVAQPENLLSKKPYRGINVLLLAVRGYGSPYWLTYIHVKDVDGLTRNARELGAKTLVEPMDIPTIGRFSVIADPTGAAVALFTGASA